MEKNRDQEIFVAMKYGDLKSRITVVVYGDKMIPAKEYASIMGEHAKSIEEDYNWMRFMDKAELSELEESLRLLKEDPLKEIERIKKWTIKDTEKNKKK